jgi:hypothetical protein
VLLPQGFVAGPQWPAFVIALGAFVLLARTRVPLHWVLAGAALAGVVSVS